jgi:hypothetical protein
MPGDVVSESHAEKIVSAARTAIGDELRSAVYFTTDGHEQLYLRSGLEPDANLDAFVGNERLGFQSQHTYGDTELGEYLATIRTFEFGYLTRASVGDEGVFVTTDEMAIDRFEEVAVALQRVLEAG